MYLLTNLREELFFFYFRSSSIVSASAQWRKESVTILEKAEDGTEEDDDEVHPPNVAIIANRDPKIIGQSSPQLVHRSTNPQLPEVRTLLHDHHEPEMAACSVNPRRLSAASALRPHHSKMIRRGSSGSSMDDNFLTVPQTVTASSSAETLTGL